MAKKHILLSVLLLCALSFPSAITYASDTQPTVTMSLTQYETLKASIETLKQNSITREQLINQQKAQIKELQKQLTISQTQIENSTNSINQTNQRLNEQSKSLEKLSQEINQQSHKYITAKRQRDTWAVAAGVLLVGMAVK